MKRLPERRVGQLWLLTERFRFDDETVVDEWLLILLRHTHDEFDPDAWETWETSADPKLPTIANQGWVSFSSEAEMHNMYDGYQPKFELLSDCP